MIPQTYTHPILPPEQQAAIDAYWARIRQFREDEGDECQEDAWDRESEEDDE